MNEVELLSMLVALKLLGTGPVKYVIKENYYTELQLSY